MKKKELDDMINGALPYFIGGALLYWAYKNLFKNRNNKHPFSSDVRVNDAISIIDSCFDRIGTFNSDLEPIFDVLESLSGVELIRLHQDFGVRYYNGLFGWYSLISFLEGFAVARPCSLSSIMYKEFDDEQIKKVESIYSSKGVPFPL